MNETKKMMEIIHQNRNKVYEAKLAKAVKDKKEDRKFKTLLCVTGLILMFIIGSIYVRYNEKQIAQCMEAGHSENFCRYDGE